MSSTRRHVESYSAPPSLRLRVEGQLEICHSRSAVIARGDTVSQRTTGSLRQAKGGLSPGFQTGSQ